MLIEAFGSYSRWLYIIFYPVLLEILHCIVNILRHILTNNCYSLRFCIDEHTYCSPICSEAGITGSIYRKLESHIHITHNLCLPLRSWSLRRILHMPNQTLYIPNKMSNIQRIDYLFVVWNGRRGIVEVFAVSMRCKREQRRRLFLYPFSDFEYENLFHCKNTQLLKIIKTRYCV